MLHRQTSGRSGTGWTSGMMVAGGRQKSRSKPTRWGTTSWRAWFRALSAMIACVAQSHGMDTPFHQVCVTTDTPHSEWRGKFFAQWNELSRHKASPGLCKVVLVASMSRLSPGGNLNQSHNGAMRALQLLPGSRKQGPRRYQAVRPSRHHQHRLPQASPGSVSAPMSRQPGPHSNQDHHASPKSRQRHCKVVLMKFMSQRMMTQKTTLMMVMLAAEAQAGPNPKAGAGLQGPPRKEGDLPRSKPLRCADGHTRFET